MDFVDILYKLIGMFCVWYWLIILLIYVYRAVRLGFFILKKKYNNQK